MRFQTTAAKEVQDRKYLADFIRQESLADTDLADQLAVTHEESPMLVEASGTAVTGPQLSAPSEFSFLDAGPLQWSRVERAGTVRQELADALKKNWKEEVDAPAKQLNGGANQSLAILL